MAINIFTNGAGGNTWNTAGNWSLGTIPTATDGHVTTFDATSPNCTLGSGRTCNHLDYSAYTNTLTTSTFTITVGGNVVLGNSTIINGTGQLVMSTTNSTTLTSNGYTWPNTLTFIGTTGTRTLIGNAIIGTLANAIANTVINSNTNETLTILNNLTPTASFAAGSAELIMTGSSAIWSGNFAIANPLTIAVNAVITISGTVRYTGGSLYTLKVLGQVNAIGSTLSLTNSPADIDTRNTIWDNVTFGTSNGTVNFTGDFNCNTMTQSVAQTINGTGRLYVNSAYNYTGITTSVTGTMTVILQKNAVLNSSMTTGTIQHPLTFNGYYNEIIGNVNFRASILTFTNKNIRTNNATLSLVTTSLTVNGAKYVGFPTINVTGGITLTMDSFFNGTPSQPCRIQSTTTANYTVTFTGTQMVRSFYVQLSNCTSSTPRQLSVITRKGNYGGNVNVLFGHQRFNAFPLNLYPAAMEYDTSKSNGFNGFN